MTEKIEQKEIEWAMGILTVDIPFCPEKNDNEVEKAIDILLTHLPEPQIGIQYKGQIFLKEKYRALCPRIDSDSDLG